MKSNIIFSLALLVFGFLSTTLRSQTIVNIESKRLTVDSSGWDGSARLGFNFNKNVERQFSLYTTAHLQHIKDRNVFLLVTNLSLVEAGKESFVNDGFVHFRYNRIINSFLEWEVFNQLQYNKILNVEERRLAGTGPRFTLANKENMRLYLGPLYMYEYERLSNSSSDSWNHRLSTYLSFNWNISEGLGFSSTLYYQPILFTFGDFRISSQAKLDVIISKTLSLTTEFHYLFDHDPPVDIPREVYSMKNALKFRF